MPPAAFLTIQKDEDSILCGIQRSADQRTALQRSLVSVGSFKSDNLRIPPPRTRSSVIFTPCHFIFLLFPSLKCCLPLFPQLNWLRRSVSTSLISLKAKVVVFLLNYHNEIKAAFGVCICGSDRPAAVWRDDDALGKGKRCPDNSEQLVRSVTPACAPSVMLALCGTNFNQVATAEKQSREQGA